jgi:hypothetical protein
VKVDLENDLQLPIGLPSARKWANWTQPARLQG